MLGSNKIKEICQFLLQRCEQAQAEVWVEVFSEGLTRFANNAIHQNVAEVNANVTLRVTLGGRTGMATTNRLDGEALSNLARQALDHACFSPVDPGFPGLAEPQLFTPVSAFDEATASFSPEQRAALVKDVCAQASSAGLNAAGAFSTSVVEVGAANSNGVFAYHPHTSAEFQVTVMGADSSGRGQGTSWQVGQVPVAELGGEALQTAIAGKNPRSLPPGEYPVILSPYAVDDIVQALNLYGASGLALLEGRSWMVDRQGKQDLSPLISLWDDGLDPLGVPQPFDGEGMPRKRVDIIKKGVVMDAVYDRAVALKAGKQSTGHGVPPEMRAFGPLAVSLFMDTGSASREQMLAQAGESALLITRFWYTRLVKPRDCTITGMTRDGVFFVKNGEIQYPVQNLRFTQSYIEALADVVAVGNTSVLQKAGFAEMYNRVPALAVTKFRFTS